MSDKLKVDGPITVQQTTPEAVAFMLMEKIAYYDKAADKEVLRGTRDYWLTLYSQCLRATKGYDLSLVLKAG